MIRPLLVEIALSVARPTGGAGVIRPLLVEIALSVARPTGGPA